MSTIEDVAKLAGLSRTTVSRVLNDHPYVSDEKKKLVQQAMKHLGYVPNSAARSLRNQKTGIIAVLIPKISTPFFSQLIERLEMAASVKNYQLIICQTQFSKHKERSYLDLLKTKQVDGVIMTSCENDWSVIDEHLNYGPIVLCNEILEDGNIPMIYMDQFCSGYEVAKHLLEQGHSRIAYCSNGSQSIGMKARKRGFEAALAEAGHPFDDEFYFQHLSSITDGKQVFQQIKGLTNPPTAIFTGGDSVAAGLISEAKKHGWNIPVDLAVVGFDNMEITELMDPMITTVIQPVEEMAQKAIEVICEKIHKKQYRSYERHEFSSKLAIRESTMIKPRLVATS
ncbi:LacI family DNA-binding transcriptional regulator [Metabacillus niabensis]|uniref:DNA-binding LacI/PurR family transcriptional regulator n=1 Tax=Metabacillus niabensis TaxID=324854 RepID=A0ABT9YXA9_9BACI|nr:LacI family DNA-binding transcriptional regulator [Metabacillus niabensis]MDQ0224241.1 DNA-binding LacI/PurR family transcriptional regulator [Metabacillus niabensis]